MQKMFGNGAENVFVGKKWTLHDFSILTGIPDILLPQIHINIPNNSPGVWLLACPFLQNCYYFWEWWLDRRRMIQSY